MHFLTIVSLLVSSASAFWPIGPIPISYKHGDTVICIRKDVQIHWYQAGAKKHNLELRKRYSKADLESDYKYSLKEGVSGDEIVEYAIKSAWNTIFKHSLYPWKFHPRNWTEPAPNKNSKKISQIDLQLLSANPSDVGKPLAGTVDESYTLTLTTEGKATISANSSIGIAHGLTTLTQLFYAHSDGKQKYTPLAPVKIFDAPKFQHRGINLDVARNFFPVPVIKRQIDAAAYNKMNRFHLHVTDSQSWPLEIPALPNLSKKGAYRPDLVYTTRDFKDLQRYAALQGVEMITEIDMPGHTSSIHYAYPDLVSAFNIQPDWGKYAAEPPTGTLSLNSTTVNKFLEKLFDDLLPRIKPYSSYFHTGGDEVNKNAYALDPTIRSSDPAVLQPLMQKFVDRNHKQVRKLGLTPVVWEEMLLEWNVTLGKDVVVQSWQSDDAVKQIVEKGHKALVGNYNFWYLDCGKGQWVNFPPSNSANFWPYNDYCAPFHNWRLIYSYDPLASVPADLAHLVLGGEAHMWTEQTDPVNVDRMIWPRAAAVAEILWAGAKDSEGRNRSQVIAAPRLSEMRERLVKKGVGAEPIQMPYCLMENGCNLVF